MALKIRLRRMGRKKSPSYRVVIAESTMPRDGRFVENIGHYNPRTEPVTLVVDRDRALFWLDQGAIPTDTTRSLLKRAGVFGPPPTVTEEAAEAVREVATKTAGKAAAAASTAAAAAADVVEDAREAVADGAAEVRETVEDARERVAGGGEAEATAESSAEPAGDEATAESAAEPAEDEAKASQPAE